MSIVRWALVVAVCVGVGSMAAGPACSQQPTAKPEVGKPKPAVPEGDNYEPGPDSMPQPDVPRGTSFQFDFDQSKVFPGTTRKITVYVPAQYKADKPACVYVGLDGLGFGAPVVFDNLIHKKEMPVLIAVGVSPGTVPSAASRDSPQLTSPRFNRSMEFDGLNGNLARLILDEILPEVEKRQTPDGLPINLSPDPNDRCTGGGSTGGIGAFTLAWERPDTFRRVFTAIGTFVGMRGGDRYGVLIRKTEPKPLRIFMQDGEHDQWMGGPEVGDWWMGNQTVQRALEFAGYDERHVWGTGVHSGRHATAIFPDAMRWLWRDWPQPITARESQNYFIKAIVEPGEEWKAVKKCPDRRRSLLVDLEGKVDDVNAFKAFGPDGRIYEPDADGQQIQSFDFRLNPGNPGPSKVHASGVTGNQLIVTHDKHIYVTAQNKGEGTIWLVRPDGEKVLLDDQFIKRTHNVDDCLPSAIALSPDGQWLAVAARNSHTGYSYRVKPDGTLDAKQQFYWLHVPDWADDAGVAQWCFDRDGRLYAATRLGVQVLDRNGRVRCILPLPGNAEATGICFGGEKFDTLYVSAGGTLYARKLKITGAAAWQNPVKLPPWGAG